MGTICDLGGIMQCKQLLSCASALALLACNGFSVIGGGHGKGGNGGRGGGGGRGGADAGGGRDANADADGPDSSGSDAGGADAGAGAAGADGGGDGGLPFVPYLAPDRPCNFVNTPTQPTGNANCPNGVYQGSIDVSSSADIEKLAGCTRISGDLNIHGVPPATLRNVAGLESLRAINGKLWVENFAQIATSPWFAQGQITSLSGLENLRCIGQSFVLATSEEFSALPPSIPASRLTEFGLDQLVEVEGKVSLRVSGGFADTLPALRRVWGDVVVSSPKLVPAIELVYGGFEHASAHSTDNPRLEYIGCGSSFPICRDGILGCARSAGNDSDVASLSACRLAVQGMALTNKVKNLEPLRELRWVRESLSIVEDDALTSLTGLRGLESADMISLNGVPQLANLHGLEGLHGSTSILVNYSESFSSLEGLENVTAFETISLRGLPKLTNLKGLSGAKSIGTLSLDVGRTSADFGKVASLSGLSALESLGNLSIIGSALEDLRGLDRVKHMKDISLANNPALRTLDGLGALEVVDQTVFLSSNHHLESLHALGKLRQVGGLSISKNQVLPDCEVSWLSERVGKANVADAINGGPRNCKTPVPASIPGLVWHKFFDDLNIDFSGNTTPDFSALRLLPDNKIALFGVGAQGEWRWIVRALSATGESLWSGAIPAGYPDPSRPTCWGVARSGTVTVVRMTATPSTQIHRFESNGASLGTTQLDVGEPDPYSKICSVDDASNIYFGLFRNGRALRKQTPSGAVLWEKALGFDPQAAPIHNLAPGVVIEETNFWTSPESHILHRFLDDGRQSFSRTISGTAHSDDVVQAPDGKIVVIGQTAQPIDAGAGAVATPRPGEGFVYLVSFASDGSAPRVRYIDGVSGMKPDIAFAPDGSSYLFVDGRASALTRPFVFGPSPNQRVTGIAVIKLNPAGNFVWARELSPLIDAWVGADGQLNPMGIAATSSRVVIAGELLRHPAAFVAQLSP
jgi:hypothetical protein